jgi:tRNA G26 N,N-dimethylase Trm1
VPEAGVRALDGASMRNAYYYLGASPQGARVQFQITGESGAFHDMANNLGKVYICGKCGSQVIVTKGGTGELKCCGGSMEQKK